MSEREIREVLEKLVKVPLPDGELADSLDSMQRLSLVVAIEDHFEICFEPEDDEAVRTVDDVVAVIRGKLS
jgi:acyl carrier protein